MKKVVAAAGRYIRSTDWWLILMCVIASGLSVVLLMGIVNSGLAYGRHVKVQALATAIGLVAALILSKIDYHFMARLWKLHASAAYFLVLLTFLIGVQVQESVDDKAWIMLPMGLSIQPSEILKISFILTFAYHLSKVQDNLNSPQNLILLCLHGALPVGLIMLQGDDGTAIIFGMIFLCMIFSAGIKWRYILLALGCVAAAAPLVWLYVMDDDKRMRVLSVLFPEQYTMNIGYQQMCSRRAIGSGQLWGKGIFYGNHQYVPEIQNDFIFAFIGESLGFFGCVLVILLLFCICAKILHTGSRSIDPLGRYICVGVFAMIAWQSMANIGMCISVLPVIGLTLPFLSAGGTSVVTVYLGIGLVLSVYMHQKTTLFSDK